MVNEKGILNNLEYWAIDNKLWEENTTVIAAVSGGCDSVFMLMALRELALKHKFSLQAIHINHGLRDAESDGDELFVQNLCKQWAIPLYIEHVDVKKSAKEWGFGIEETARKIRRQIFSEISSKDNTVIALAHIADDVVETFLFNLMRGTGVRGLSAIVPKDGIIIRPILPLWKKQIYEVLSAQDIDWREDSSNLDMQYSRNRIRHELIPFIESHFGRDNVEQIESASQMLRQTNTSLDHCTKMLYDKALLDKCPGMIAFRAENILTDPFSFGEFLRMALSQLDIGLKDFSRKSVDRVYEKLVESGHEKKITLYGGAFAVRIGNSVIITDNEPVLSSVIPIDFNNPAVLDGGLGTISAKTIPKPDVLKSADNFTALLAYNDERITVQSHTSGIDFQPLGGVSMSLASFIKKRRIPGLFRKALPLVFLDKKLAWVAGAGISEQYKITNDTEKVLRLSWKGDFPKVVTIAMSYAKLQI